jgi:hypothetical protein
MSRSARFALLFFVALLAAACASTSLRDSWTDPNFRGGPFRKLMVVGVSNTPVNRRVFEDSFAAKLKAVGVDAVRSYEVLPQSGTIPQQAFDAAARQSGADGLLMVHVKAVDTKTQVTSIPQPVMMGYYGAYMGWTSVPQITQYDLATIETNLYDVASDRLVWSGITETFNPGSVATETPGFADVIIKALTDRGMLPKAK